MSSSEGKYNIKAVSNLLGIPSGTLRAWERRYQVIAPVRNEAGHRLYNEKHIRILKWLIDKMNKGITISQAINLLDKDEKLTDIAKSGELSSDGEGINVTIEKLVEAFINFDESTAHEIMDYAFSVFSVDKVAIEILGSVLIKMGQLWEEKKITSAHEHFASSLLRSKIGHIMHTLPVHELSPKVIAVCAPNEWHELGLLIFSLYLKKKGYKVIYLGVSIAPEDLFTVLQEIKPKILILSCTMGRNIPHTLELVKRLEKDYPKLEIGLGGPVLSLLEPIQKETIEQYLIGGNRNEWDSWLELK